MNNYWTMKAEDDARVAAERERAAQDETYESAPLLDQQQPDDEETREAKTQIMRYLSRTMLLWAFCRRAGCYRKRACLGEPRDCLARYAPLVPEDVRDWVKAMIAGNSDKREFEDVRQDNEEAFEAMIEWRGLIEQAAAPRSE